MSTKQIISSFEQFERIYESVERGEKPTNEDEINEGMFSGIMNFFSRVFGGRITDLDRILRRYKRNEADYWNKWADANHEYNRAAALRDTVTDTVEKRKHLEMMERSNKLIRQAARTRGDVNNALDRQAIIMIRGNRRLRMYWDMKKAKADEKVANASYSSLKKKVDEDTLDELYDRVRETRDKAKAKIKKMPKGSMTIDFGEYTDASDSPGMQPLSRFGIHDLDDFIYAEDDLWQERIKLMPPANHADIAKNIQDVIEEIEGDTAESVKKYKKKLETATGDDRARMTNELKQVQDYADGDIEMLTARYNQLTGNEPAEPDKKLIEPEKESSELKKRHFSERLADEKKKLVKRLGDAEEEEVVAVMMDMISLYDKLPKEDKDEEDEEDVRMVQLIDFSQDIHRFRKDNKIAGKAAGKDLETLYKEFKTEFPK